MNPLLLKYNKTTRFIMPMAFYHRKDIKGNDIISNTEFKNAYIGDIDEPEFDDKIMLVWKDFEEVYEIPIDFEDDYWNIVSSQYSNLSDKYKNYLLEFWDADNASELFKILNVKKPLGFKPEMKKNLIHSKIKELVEDFDIFEEIYNMRVSL